MFTSQTLAENNVYTRNDLIAKFDITDMTINTGIFQPEGHNSIWLFITHQKTQDMTPYVDNIVGDILYWDGQKAGRKDNLIIDHEKNGLELLVFYRRDKKEFSGSGFSYKGRFRYISHTGSNPAHFKLQYVKP